MNNKEHASLLCRLCHVVVVTVKVSERHTGALASDSCVRLFVHVSPRRRLRQCSSAQVRKLGRTRKQRDRKVGNIHHFTSIPTAAAA